RDLNVIDVRPVPDRLEQGIGKAQGEQVLDRFLAQVVVDAEDRLRWEYPLHGFVQVPGAGQVVAEGFLEDHTPPGTVVVLGQPGGGQLVQDHRELVRGDGQIEGVVAFGAPFLIRLLDRPGQALERLGVGELTLDEPDALAQLPPRTLVERGPGVFARRFQGYLLEILPTPLPAGETRQGEAGG